jgi:hypothetical protein
MSQEVEALSAKAEWDPRGYMNPAVLCKDAQSRVSSLPPKSCGGDHVCVDVHVQGCGIAIDTCLSVENNAGWPSSASREASKEMSWACGCTLATTTTKKHDPKRPCLQPMTFNKLAVDALSAQGDQANARRRAATLKARLDTVYFLSQVVEAQEAAGSSCDTEDSVGQPCPPHPPVCAPCIAELRRDPSGGTFRNCAITILCQTSGADWNKVFADQVGECDFEDDGLQTDLDETSEIGSQVVVSVPKGGVYFQNQQIPFGVRLKILAATKDADAMRNFLIQEKARALAAAESVPSPSPGRAPPPVAHQPGPMRNGEPSPAEQLVAFFSKSAADMQAKGLQATSAALKVKVGDLSWWQGDQIETGAVCAALLVRDQKHREQCTATIGCVNSNGSITDPLSGGNQGAPLKGPCELENGHISTFKSETKMDYDSAEGSSPAKVSLDLDLGEGRGHVEWKAKRLRMALDLIAR